MSHPNVEFLLEECRSGKAARQIKAVTKLQELKAFESASSLLGLLSSPEDTVRLCVLEALGWIGAEEIEKIGPALIQALDDPEFLIRSEALEAIGRLPYRPAIEITKTLLLEDPEWVVRATAAETLIDLAEKGDVEVLSALELALDDSINTVRSYAAYSIGLLGESNSELLSRLQMYLLSEESLTTKAEILAAKFRLGVNDDLKKLLDLFNDADENLTGVILNILEDLSEHETSENFLDYMPRLNEILIKVSDLFPNKRNHVKRIISQLKQEDN